MKVKLLKKIRKRFKIVHYPNGIPMGSDGNWMVLYDRDSDYGFGNEFKFINYPSYEKETYNELVSILRKRILEHYKEYGTRRLAKRTNTILWYKEKK